MELRTVLTAKEEFASLRKMENLKIFKFTDHKLRSLWGTNEMVIFRAMLWFGSHYSGLMVSEIMQRNCDTILLLLHKIDE